MAVEVVKGHLQRDRMVIELMETALKTGFEEKTAIDLINSAYIAGTTFNNPVTMDMSIIDCQAGSY